MNWSFLNPWFLLGAFAVAAPLWLHLRRKTETNLLRFSALRFLDDAPQARASPLRLCDVLLCALRVLALLLLVGAFAWPYVRKNLIVVRESRVYILDNTLSHQAGDGFVRDRSRIIDEIGASGVDVQVAVIELTAQPRVLAAFGDGREEAKRRLNNLAPSFQRGAFLAAFRQAHALLANSLGERKRIIFCSDNQENQWTENADAPPFLRGIEVEMPKPGATNAPNLALSEPRLQRLFLGDKSMVNFSVTLTHIGEAKSANVTLRSNGQLIFSRVVALEKQPETMLLQAQWEADPSLWLSGEVSLEGQPDSLAGDNRAFFSLPPMREGSVVLLAQSTYLRLALSPDVMQGHWVTRVLDPTRLADENAAGEDAEVLVIESGYLQSNEARKLVWHYLTNGRGVILLVNRLTPAVAGALRELGFEAQTSGASRPAGRERIRYFLSNHAVFHPFLSPAYGNLLEITVEQHQRLKAMEGIPLMFSESGDALVFQGTKFTGRLFITAFGFEREQTSWPAHVTFVPFLDLCLQNSRPEDATPIDYAPGAVCVLNLPSHSTAREVVVSEDQREVHRASVVQGKARFRLPDQPGLYAVRYDSASQPDRILSVNSSPKESNLAYLSAPETLKLWQAGSRAEAPQPLPSAAPAKMSLAAIRQQQIWWWLLLAGLAALLVEQIWTSVRKEWV